MSSKRVVLVTGASSGIGLATARLFQSRGDRVFGTSRSKPEEASFEFIRTDVTKQDSVVATVNQVLATAGRIDVLVNNAGLVLIGAVEESSEQQIKMLFDTNFFGAVSVAKAVLPVMRKQRSGRIVNVSSVVGFVPAPFMTYYCASKHALEGFSESLDHEVRPFGIRSVLIEPGFTKTSINSHSLKADQSLDAYDKARGTALRVVEEGVQGAASPERIANLIVRVADAPQPKPRYAADAEVKLLKMMRALLPSSLFDKGIRKQFNLDKV